MTELRPAHVPGTRDRGVTLVEMLVTIVLLGVLAAVTTIAITGTTSTASATACDADRATLERAASAWRTQHPDQPVSMATLVNEQYLRSASEMHGLAADGSAVGTGRCAGHQPADPSGPGPVPAADEVAAGPVVRPSGDAPGRSGDAPGRQP